MSKPPSRAQIDSIRAAAAASPWRNGPNCATKKAHRSFREFRQKKTRGKS